jgi:DNA ligase (NAD+)
MGAAVSTAVGKKTDYLIAGENPGSKMERALQLIDSGENAGLKIISEEQFESLSLS